MEKVTHQLVLFVVLLTNAIAGGCSSCLGSLETQSFKIHPELLQPSVDFASSQKSTYSYVANHVITGPDNDKYYGIEATLDVYGFSLEPGQLSAGGIWIKSIGDGQPINGISVGWQIYPGLYKDSRAHFYVVWTIRGSPAKGCFNMICDGFQRTSSSIAPGDVISQVSSINGTKQYITVRLLKDKSSGHWHVYYGINSSLEHVGYFPKTLLPGMIDKPVELRFGGYVSHETPSPSPPMGSGYTPLNGTSASVSSLKLIDADGKENSVNTNLPFEETRPDCYPVSHIDSGRFFYGGPGCSD
ncbi:unnamed protein product [Alopecurus aequalis]